MSSSYTIDLEQLILSRLKLDDINSVSYISIYFNDRVDKSLWMAKFMRAFRAFLTKDTNYEKLYAAIVYSKNPFYVKPGFVRFAIIEGLDAYLERINLNNELNIHNLILAVKYKRYTLIKEFIALYTLFETDNKTSLLYGVATAIEMNDIDAVKLFIEYGVDMEPELDEDSTTFTKIPLIVATNINRVSICNLLIDRGYTMYAQDALNIACIKNHVKIAKMLFKVPDLSFETPCYNAAMIGSLKILKSMPHNEYITSDEILYLAAEYGNTDIVDWIQDYRDYQYDFNRD